MAVTKNLMRARAWVVFDYQTAESWAGADPYVLYRTAQRLSQRANKSVNDTFDNTHFHVADIHDQIVLIVSFGEDSITLWVKRTGVWVGMFDPRKLTQTDIREIIDRASEGKSPCGDCGKWVKNIKHYGFAGGSCPKCYDPNKHLPPDTAGD